MRSPAVSNAMVEAAIDAWENVYEAELHIGSPTYTDNKEVAMRAALTVAIGAGDEQPFHLVEEFDDVGAQMVVASAIGAGGQAVASDQLVEIAADIVGDRLEIDYDGDEPYVRSDSIETAVRDALSAVGAFAHPAPSGQAVAASWDIEATAEEIARSLSAVKGGRLHGPAYSAAKAGALEAFNRALSAIAHPVPQGWRPTHRHVKRGSEYMLLGIGKMQTSYWHDFISGLPEKAVLADMREVAVYRGEDGKLWVRPREEFEDGRFEVLPAAPQPKGD